MSHERELQAYLVREGVQGEAELTVGARTSMRDYLKSTLLGRPVAQLPVQTGRDGLAILKPDAALERDVLGS